MHLAPVLIVAVAALTLGSGPRDAGVTKPAGPRFAYDWKHIQTSRCRPVDAKLERVLKTRFVCTPGMSGSSGVEVLEQCTSRRGNKEYLVFRTQEDCVSERDAQLANGED